MSGEKNKGKRILVLYAHPGSLRTRVNRLLLQGVQDLPSVEVVDLYENYPDFFIDVKREQRRLMTADLIVMQHPLYWYSAPALLKQWQDMVLEEGFAFGEGGSALRGKRLLTVVTTGHSERSYQRDGYDRYSIESFLRPYEQTAYHCGMIYLQPVAIYAAERLSDQEVASQAAAYRRRLQAFLNGEDDG